MMVLGLLQGWAALLAPQVRISAALEQDETQRSVLLAAPNPCTLTSCDCRGYEVAIEFCRCWGVDAPAIPASLLSEEDEGGWEPRRASSCYKRGMRKDVVETNVICWMMGVMQGTGSFAFSHERVEM